MRYRDLIEAAGAVEPAGATLYHTTSAWAAAEILRTGEVRPKGPEGFVSFSEAPLPTGDIAAKDVTIGFRAAALAGQVEQVEYTEDWFDAHPDQGAYIAGEGWTEQYEPPEDIYDEDGLGDDDAEADAYREGELESFLQKSDEDEHISRAPGVAVRFGREAVALLIIHQGDPADWTEELSGLGYAHVAVHHTP